MKITIIGGGNMGSAFAEGTLRTALCTPRDLCIVEPVPDRRAELVGQYKCLVADSIKAEAFSGSECIILAVKPQNFAAVAEALKGILKGSQLIISIMAGVSLGSISASLNDHSKVVRCMPNMGALIGKGMNVYFAQQLQKNDRQIVEAILNSLGESLQVSDEFLVDAATAVSGSGPAYVFFILEHMLEEAQELGFSEEEAFQLVSQTFAGALSIWSSGKKSAGELKKMVTSKGGTTEAALSVFTSGEMDKVFRAGIRAAFDRAQEISRQ